MKYLLLSFIVLSTLSIHNSGIKIFNVGNHDKYFIKQEYISWCWASVVESLYKINNKKISQKDIFKTFNNKKEINIMDYSINGGAITGYRLKNYFNKFFKSVSKVYHFEVIRDLENENKPLLIIMPHMDGSHITTIVGYKIYNDQTLYKIVNNDIDYKSYKSKFYYVNEFVIKKSFIYNVSPKDNLVMNNNFSK